MTGLSGVAIGAKLLGLRSAAKGAADWTTQNTSHLLLVALVAVFAWGWIGHHEADKWKRAEQSSEAARVADGKVWSQAFNTEQDSVRLLLTTLHHQNAAVKALQTTALDRQAANHQAVLKLAERAKTSEALSARMKAAFAASGSEAGKDGQCASDASVLAGAKGGAL